MIMVVTAVIRSCSVGGAKNEQVCKSWVRFPPRLKIFCLRRAITHVRGSLPYRAPLYPPCAGHVIWRPCAFGSFDVRCVMCVGERFACSVAFYFIDVDVLIRPGDAQKYVSRRSFVLFAFVTLYLFRVRVASFLYIVIFSCTDRRKDV